MRKLAFAIALFALCVFSVSAQQPQPQPDDRAGEPMSVTYRQTDEVRNELGLDYKQFEKVYKAYKKYNDAVYGADPKPQQSFRGGGPRPGGGRPGGHGGPGGPGGGGRQHDFNGGRPPMGGQAAHPAASQKKVDPAKLEATKAKQEEKLRKSMKKIFKTPEVYDRWLEIRERQLNFRPTPPAPPSEPVVK